MTRVGYRYHAITYDVTMTSVEYRYHAITYGVTMTSVGYRYHAITYGVTMTSVGYRYHAITYDVTMTRVGYRYHATTYGVTMTSVEYRYHKCKIQVMIWSHIQNVRPTPHGWVLWIFKKNDGVIRRFDCLCRKILIINAVVIHVSDLIAVCWASTTQQIWPPVADDTRQSISYNIYRYSAVPIQILTIDTHIAGHCKGIHWNKNVISTTFSSLLAPEVVIVTTSNAAHNDNFIKMTFIIYFHFSIRRHIYMRSTVKINVYNVDMCLGNTAETFANFQSTELFNANLGGFETSQDLMITNFDQDLRCGKTP